jgi:hypothetical protein
MSPPDSRGDKHMGDPNSSKPGSRPSAPPSSPTTPSRGAKPDAAPDPSAGRSGRVVHDERGNAVWDWLKDTGRMAIDSTSRLLKRLEVPELKVEDTQDSPLSIESDRDPGGGYDPYGGSAANKAGPGRGVGQGRGAGSGRGTASQGSSPAKRDTGGGYDPYGKGVTRKPARKP